MNRNDLFDALSGIDPKYIDEAAFELHESPADKRKAKVFSVKRSLFVVLPAAAAILLTVTALFTLRHNKNESASFAPAADSATEMPAAEAPAYEYEEPAAEAAETAAEAEETAEAYDEEPIAEAQPEAAGEAAEGTSHSYDLKENADDIQTIMPATNQDALKKTDRSNGFIGLTGASFDDGILTLTITEKLPEDIKNIRYSITGKTADGSNKTFAEGTLDEVIKEKDPLTLDISELKLTPGTYVLSIGGETAEFEIE